MKARMGATTSSPKRLQIGPVWALNGPDVLDNLTKPLIAAIAA
jgi:hypothetical protein